MTVFYRMCGIPSTNPSPILQEDKYRLNKVCLRSFVKAFKEVNPYVHFILDYCSADYIDLLTQEVPFDFNFEVTTLGINGTMLRSYELAKHSAASELLFQECDYYYLPETGYKLQEAIKSLHLVSPYDHRNFYIDRTIHSRECEVVLLNEHHYRTVERNTMTFGMSRKAFEDNYEILKKWGYLDNEVWHEMRANGYPLYVPIPSFSTHMVKDFLAPGIDWKEKYGG